MIADYDNPEAMAALGRRAAKRHEIKRAKESIRDSAVRIGASNNEDEIRMEASSLAKNVESLLEAMALED